MKKPEERQKPGRKKLPENQKVSGKTIYLLPHEWEIINTEIKKIKKERENR